MLMRGVGVGVFTVLYDDAGTVQAFLFFLKFPKVHIFFSFFFSKTPYFFF